MDEGSQRCGKSYTRLQPIDTVLTMETVSKPGTPFATSRHSAFGRPDLRMTNKYCPPAIADAPAAAHAVQLGSSPVALRALAPTTVEQIRQALGRVIAVHQHTASGSQPQA